MAETSRPKREKRPSTKADESAQNAKEAEAMRAATKAAREKKTAEAAKKPAAKAAAKKPAAKKAAAKEPEVAPTKPKKAAAAPKAEPIVVMKGKRLLDGDDSFVVFKRQKMRLECEASDKVEDFDAHEIARRASLGPPRPPARPMPATTAENSRDMDPALASVTWADLERISPAVWRRATRLAREFGYDY